MRKFEAIVNEMSLDDFGVASGTFEVQSLTKGKVYMEHVERTGSKPTPSGHVIDDNACWWKIGTDSFNKRFKEIKE